MVLGRVGAGVRSRWARRTEYLLYRCLLKRHELVSILQRGGAVRASYIYTRGRCQSAVNEINIFFFLFTSLPEAISVAPLVPVDIAAMRTPAGKHCKSRHATGPVLHLLVCWFASDDVPALGDQRCGTQLQNFSYPPVMRQQRSAMALDVRQVKPTTQQEGGRLFRYPADSRDISDKRIVTCEGISGVCRGPTHPCRGPLYRPYWGPSWNEIRPTSLPALALRQPAVPCLFSEGSAQRICECPRHDAAPQPATHYAPRKPQGIPTKGSRRCARFLI